MNLVKYRYVCLFFMCEFKIVNMVKIGQYNQLVVNKEVDFGLYLDGGDQGEILLPTRYVPADVSVGDTLTVFIYHDNEGRLIATTERPYAAVEEFAFLEVREATSVGAFLDWGIMKDLLVPFREQKVEMLAGRKYVVYVREDELTGRVVASSKVDKFLNNIPPEYTYNQEVSLLIYEENELGFKAIIENKHSGLLYRNEVFTRLEIGQSLKGFIKNVREDTKIDLSVTPLGFVKIGGLAEQVLDELRKQQGFIPVNDKTDPEIIYQLFNSSKKAFKQAIGTLYKKQLIRIDEKGIYLLLSE